MLTLGEALLGGGEGECIFFDPIPDLPLAVAPGMNNEYDLLVFVYPGESVVTGTGGGLEKLLWIPLVIFFSSEKKKLYKYLK